MSIERQVKLALWRVTFWRLLGTVFSGLPEMIFSALARLVRVGEDFFGDVGRALFAMELDAARRYFALTGLDLAMANGDDDRYREIRVAAGVEAEPDAVEDPDDED